MLEAIERRESSPFSELIFPPSPADFYAALSRKPKPIEEVVSYAPKALTLIETYYQDLQVFLSQEPIIASRLEIRALQGQQAHLEVDFQSQMQSYHRSYQELIRLQEQILEREKTVRRVIAAETDDPRTIINRTRVKIYEQRNQPKRRLLGRIAARIPGVAIPVHPLLIPIIGEKERIKTAIKTTEEEIITIRERHGESLNPLKKSLGERQDHLNQTFILWVTENPQRLLAHLVLLPQETDTLRKIFHQRFPEDKEAKEALESGLKELGLVTVTKIHPRIKSRAIDNGFRRTAETVTKPPRVEHNNGWGVVLEGNDPNCVIRTREELTEAINRLLGNQVPPQQRYAIISCLLRFQVDPLRTGQKVGAIKGGSLRAGMSEFKIYLPGAWRAFFELKTDPMHGQVIKISEIMPHGKWEQRYR